MSHHKPPVGAVLNPLHPLSRGLVGYWLFNEGAGSLVNDISGYKNHGNIVGVVPNVQGSGWHGSKFGGAMTFDGVNDCVDCGNDESLSLTDAITISMWVNMGTTQVDYATPINKEVAYEIRRTQENTLLFSLYIDGAWRNSGPYSYTPNELTNWGITYSAITKQIIVYENGIGKTPVTLPELATYNINTNSNKVSVGARALSNRFLNGSIDGVHIYNRALSPFEARQLYKNPFCNLLMRS